MVLGTTRLPVVCHAARSSNSAVEQQHGMAPSLHGAGDLVEVALHGLCVGVRHGQRRIGAARRVDGTKQGGALIALVGGPAWPRPTPCPLADEPVLLAKPHLIPSLRSGQALEPDLDRLAFGDMGHVGLQRGRDVRLKAAMTRSS